MSLIFTKIRFIFIQKQTNFLKQTKMKNSNKEAVSSTANLELKKYELTNESINSLENKVRKEIEKQKRKLVAKAKKSGLYENFGQRECDEIECKFNLNSYDKKTLHCYYLIREFDNWCMDFDLSCIK